MDRSSTVTRSEQMALCRSNYFLLCHSE